MKDVQIILYPLSHTFKHVIILILYFGVLIISHLMCPNMGFKIRDDSPFSLSDDHEWMYWIPQAGEAT